MAIFHLKAKIIKRQGSGKKTNSSVSAAAYRHRAAMSHGDENFRYTRKNSDMVDEFIMSPELENNWITKIINYPDISIAQKSEFLWNAVEKTEKRKDAQLAREIEISLHHELTIEQNKKLLKTFIQKNFIEKGMIADVAIHNPGNNLHAHVMLTTRDLEGAGFGKKNRTWNDKNLILEWRKNWEIESNLALKAHSPQTPEISCETLAKQRENALAAGNLELAAALDRESVRHIRRENQYLYRTDKKETRKINDINFKNELKERQEKRQEIINEKIREYIKNRVTELSKYLSIAASRARKRIRNVRVNGRERLVRAAREVFIERDNNKPTIGQGLLQNIESKIKENEKQDSTKENNRIQRWEHPFRVENKPKPPKPRFRR